MNKQENETMITAKLESVREELIQNIIDENKIEYPEYNSVYYYIDTRGYCCKGYWTDTIVDKERFVIGNYFRTKEDAHFQVERLKVIAELKRYAEPKDRAWDTNNVHWCINYDYIEESIVFHFSQCEKKSVLYFLSRQEAAIAVETVGVDRIKKYYLGVEE